MSIIKSTLGYSHRKPYEQKYQQSVVSFGKKKSEHGLISSTQLESMSFPTPSSTKKSGGQSMRSRWLRSGSLGGYPNCVALEGLLHTKRNDHCHVTMNATEAWERCLDLGVALNKIANNL